MKVVFDTLIKMGYQPKIPPNCDGWTSTGENGWHVFTYHVLRLLNVFEANPYCVISADIDFYWNVDDEVMTEFLKENKVEAPAIVPEKKIYYRHPLKGTIAICDFASACEVFTIESKSDSKKCKDVA